MHWWAQEHQKAKKTMENTGTQPKNSASGIEKPLYNSRPDQEHPSGGWLNLCQRKQTREVFARVHTEGLPQDMHHW